MADFGTVCKGRRIYAIGDVHGYVKPLIDLHGLIARDISENPIDNAVIIHLGDYVDRGPESPYIFDFLIEQSALDDGVDRRFLLGNHEWGMMVFMKPEKTDFDRSWLKWGGFETLQSYDVFISSPMADREEIMEAKQSFAKNMPQAHKDFLMSCLFSARIGGYFFAHAGADLLQPLHKQNRKDLMTIRYPFLKWDEDLPSHRIVHGHTITKDYKPKVLDYRINVDTGLYKGGPLTAAVLEGDNVRFLHAYR